MNIQKIALIRTDLIGDFLLWLESASRIRKTYPSAHITLICNSIYVELAQEVTCFDQIIALDIQKLRKFNLIYLLKICAKLRQKTYDLLINPIITRNSIVDLLSLLSINANIKVASNADYNKYKKLKPLFDKFYDKLINLSITGLHELELNNQFCNQLLNSSTDVKLPDLIHLLKTPPSQFILENFKRYIAVNLSTSTSSRNWPIENFSKLLSNIPEDIAIIILGSKNEQPLAHKIIQNFDSGQIIDKTGKTTLIESLTIIKSASIFIGNESALVHIATLLNTNTISFLGGGYAHRFLPYPTSLIVNTSVHHKVLYHQLPCFNCRWHCQYPLENNTTWRCIANIGLDDAISALSESLNNEL